VESPLVLVVPMVPAGPPVASPLPVAPACMVVPVVPPALIMVMGCELHPQLSISKATFHPASR
jgi:hypothetical protein